MVAEHERGGAVETGPRAPARAGADPGRGPQPTEPSAPSRHGAEDIRRPAARRGAVPGALLVYLPFPTNTGFAIDRLEAAFFAAACAATGDPGRVHFAWPSLAGGAPRALPAGFANLHELDPARAASVRAAAERVRALDVRHLLGLDLPTARGRFPYHALRRAGIRSIVTHFGAPISGLNRGVKLLAKRLEMRARRALPDHYVFESEAMRATAVRGRGIAPRATSVVPLGVDAERFAPAPCAPFRAHDALGIPRERRIVLYSGHMEPRKGVDVLLRAAVELVAVRGRRDVHFVIAGNRPGEEQRFAPICAGTAAERHVLFAGYRDDLPALEPSCYAGAIASVGWDSFTYSSLEMAACGLPLVASRLQGLAEAVEDGRTGFLFEPGDARALADRLEALLDQPALRDAMGRAARERVLRGYTQEHHVAGLRDVLLRIFADPARPDAPGR